MKTLLWALGVLWQLFLGYSKVWVTFQWTGKTFDLVLWTIGGIVTAWLLTFFVAQLAHATYDVVLRLKFLALFGVWPIMGQGELRSYLETTVVVPKLRWFARSLDGEYEHLVTLRTEIRTDAEAGRYKDLLLDLAWAKIGTAIARPSFWWRYNVAEAVGFNLTPSGKKRSYKLFLG